MNKASPSPVVLIAGPTASGKSALAMALADLVPSVIINADAMQVYRDLRIVTARPSVADEARHPHRLFGHVDGSEAYSAALWASEAKVAIGEAHAHARLPIVVGGTGLYMRTLLEGIAPIPDIDPAIRSEVRAMMVADSYAALMHEDPVTAARLAAADTTRVARALEVVRSTGQTLGEWQRLRRGGIGREVRLSALVVLPPRVWLFARCDARFAQIANTGRNEVASLVAREIDPRLPMMRAIGVREIAALLARRTTEEAAVIAGALATRRYAKRQFTWFTNQAPADWLRHCGQLDNTNLKSLALILRDRAL